MFNLKNLKKMEKKSFLKKLLLIAAIVGLVFSPLFLQAQQQLFSVTQNGVSKKAVAQLSTEIAKSEIYALSLKKNIEDKDIYPFAFSSVENTKIIILNEQTGANVVLTPAQESPAELQLAPFFIEELKQGTLGEANRYLVVETTSDYSVKSVSSVSGSNGNVPLPRYFYGEKENAQEALPAERQIIGIFKAKPNAISAFPDDPVVQQRIAQWEEARSYYVYMFELPDGTMCIYDEHLKSDTRMEASRADGPLQFNLSGNTSGEVRTATQYACSVWSKKLAGKVPIDIEVNSKNLGDPTVLGCSYSMQDFFQTQTNTWVCSSLWNQLVGYDATTQRDINIEMNSAFSFYYGTDGNTPYSKHDFVTIIIHEVCHGLGFACNIFYTEDTQWSKWFGIFYYSEGTEYIYFDKDYPNSFSRQLFQGTSGPCVSELSVSQRAALCTSGNLYAGRPGSKLLAANGGNRVKMFAPSSYMDGSSLSHWDESVTFTTFMKYSIGSGQSCHTIGYELYMMVDMGWTENVATGDCEGVSNMKVVYASDCNSVQISWNAPSNNNPRGTVLNESFSSNTLPAGWTNVDADGDGYKWQFSIKNQPPNCTDSYPQGHGDTYCINSASYYNCLGALSPNNWLITPALQLESNTKLTYWVKALDPSYPSDHYGVYISTSGTNPSDFTLLFEETLTSAQQDWTQRTVNTTKSGTCYFAFRHFNSNDVYIFCLDDVVVTTEGGGGGGDCQVRFQKEKAYTDATKMAVWDSNKNPLASHDFGTSAGTSPYYTISPGSHVPVVYITGDEKWYYLLDTPYTYNFQTGHKYTVVLSDDGTYLTGYVKDDGGSGGDFKYNIYRDGVLVKGNHDQTSYTDSGFDPDARHTWVVKVACAGGGESGPATVNRGCKDAIIETTQSPITIVPNPTKGEWRIESGNLKIENIEIFDVFGRIVEVAHPTLRGGLGGLLPSGVYFIRITTENGVVTKKVVKQ